MGVTYKLKDEVVQFILNQKLENANLSCRQLSEQVEAKFQVHVSKSSVHDVLKEAHIVTPRGRKPKDKFQIPQQKKEQLKAALLQTMLLEQVEAPRPPSPLPTTALLIEPPNKTLESLFEKPDDLSKSADKDIIKESPQQPVSIVPAAVKPSAIYDKAGAIFLKAAMWDLGIFESQPVKENEWDYYLTYAQGVRIFLEDDRSLLIKVNLPLQRCIFEVADCLISNLIPWVIDQMPEGALFQAAMEASPGNKMSKISIVDENNHEIVEFRSIVDYRRKFSVISRSFMVSKEKDPQQRAIDLFFTQSADNNEFIDIILNAPGYDLKTIQKYTVNLMTGQVDINHDLLQSAIDRVNAAFIRDSQGRVLVIQTVLA